MHPHYLGEYFILQLFINTQCNCMATRCGIDIEGSTNLRQLTFNNRAPKPAFFCDYFV